MRRLFFLAFLIPLTAWGQIWDTQPHRHFDYYNLTTTRWRELCKSNEKHHLRPGIEKLHRALMEHKPGLMQNAAGEFHYVLRNFPNHPYALDYMAKAQIALGTPEIAEHYFRRALELYPNHAQTYTVYGVFLHDTGKLDGAIEAYKKALDLDADSAEAAYDLGLAYFEKGDYELANHYAHQAYQKDYPLPGLRDMLKANGSWVPPSSEHDQPLTSSD